MFGRKQNAAVGAKGSDALFYGLSRGIPAGTPTGADETFPTAETLAADASLAFDVMNTDGRLFLGMVNATMKKHGGKLAAHGGHLVGIQDDRHMMIVAGYPFTPTGVIRCIEPIR